MTESDALAYDDHDINSQFIIIQSCLKDERHNEFIQNSRNITLLEDNLTFNLGDSFDCFEALTSRLEAHSKQSNVYYWLRDSRTVAGARSKTTRPINSTLKYFNVNYVCVYGGKSVNPRGEGKRKRMSMRLDCPAHIRLRVNHAGVRLDVVSVCNHHNHPINPHIYSHLPQVRRLPSDLKPDVYDMLRMGVVKRRILDYVRWRSGKILTLKDMINIAATVKNNTDSPSQQRRKCLLETLKKLELENGKFTPQPRTAKATLDRRRRPTKKFTVNDIVKTEDTTGGATKELATLPMEQEPAVEVTLQPEDGLDGRKSLTERTELDVDSVIEIQYEDENHDSITHSNIMKYLYQTDCDGERVITILNNDHMVTLEPSVLSEQHFIHPDKLCEDQDVELGEDKVIVQELKTSPMYIAEDQHFMSEYPQIWSNCEVILEETQISSNNMACAGGETHCDNIFNNNCDTEQVIEGSSQIVQVVEKCSNCEKIKANLNLEVNRLQEEKIQLKEETERLRRAKKKLEQQMKGLQMKL